MGVPYFNWRGDTVRPFSGAQFANPPYSTKSVNQRWRGNLYWETIGGLPCARLENTVPPAATPPWTLCAGTFVRNPVPLVYPVDRAYALALYIPAGFMIPNVDGIVTMLEQRFVNVGGHGPLTFHLKKDRIECTFLCGAYDGVTKQYQFNPKNTPTKIVARAFRPGWNYIAWQVHWAKDSTGHGAFYYRAQGYPTWLPGDTFSGFPTYLYQKGKIVPTVGVDLLNNYEWAVTTKFTLRYRRYIECDLLSDAQSLVAVP